MAGKPTTTVYLQPDERDAGERLASRQARSISAQLRHYIREGLRRDGVKLPDDEPEDPPRAA